MNYKDDFAVFILSHGRADNLITLDTLNKQKYTGKIYIIIDDTDKQIDEYKKLENDRIKVIVFDKEKAAEKTDTIDNFKKMNIVVYARNKTWDIAEELGLKYFLVLDDDYVEFNCRYNKDDKLKSYHIKNLDEVFKNMLDFLINTNADVVALAQSGDFIGGKDGTQIKKRILRKAMNSFFCRTDRRLEFKGSTNEDATMYVLEGGRGKLIMTYTGISLTQQLTQQNKGGLTDIYLEQGTYVKSFYTVIASPSNVKVRSMGWKNKRLHHNVAWNYVAPKIINERYKK